MTIDSLSVAEFVKGVDGIFERQLKLLNELREAFRLIAEAMQKNLHDEELPPLKEIGVNNNYFNSKVTQSDIRTSPPVEHARSVLTP
ncbi:hypothetical protein [Pseudomonas putida]|uniref:hypothetical protein n=1 Tax=Pseudomonas putida TaxID=303 RepID=UPI001CD75DB9|nr:hypothetical protein [Pseudomonas putida]